MKNLLKRISSGIGAGARAFVALVGVAGISLALANYAMTQGSGTTFGSIVVSTVHYAQQLICDVTTPSQCATVKAASTAPVATDPAIVVAESPNSPLLTTPASVRGQDSEQTAVANGANVPMAGTLTGKPIVMPFANPENALNGQITTAMTATTSTAVTGMGAQGVGVRVYITACMISNTHATVGTMVNLQDGSGGSVLWQFPAAPAYNGSTLPISPAVRTTANTALFAVNATTGSSTLVSCTGYKGI